MAYPPALLAERHGATETVARVLLFLFVFSGSFVLIEPSPYEMFFVPAFVMFMLAGLRLHVSSMPMLLLLILLNIGGILALFPVIGKPDTIEYVIISIFMAANALFFAALMTTHTLERFAVLRRAYILSAVIAAIAGIVGYFDIGGSSELLTAYNRAKGFFKDPNVFAPFLILPLVLMLQDMLLGKPRTFVILAGPYFIVLLGIFLSFSRAAWMHTILSSALAVLFLLVFSNSRMLRLRVVAVCLVGTVAIAFGLIALISQPAVRDVFKERASLSQTYDVQAGGRFFNQVRALGVIQDNPQGLGPFEFSRRMRNDPHNVYLNAFLAYGWIGGVSYAALILLTWAAGFSALFRPSPYRRPLGAVMATFSVLSLEGIIIDSDHWRHFFLLLGLVWGFVAAVHKWQREPASAYLRTAA